jgi:peptidoglycan/xylan/chitin deacetylase (PgdA/CDA1 family)
LLVLNYHRIGNVADAAFDADVYSATADELDWQVGYLKSRFGIISLDEAIDWTDQPARGRGAAALITFDDGYVDNFRTAFPILRARGVQATFFLPTGFVGTRRIPWWDRVARAVRAADGDQVRVEREGGAIDIDLRSTSRTAATRGLLAIYKSLPTDEAARFVDAIEYACGVRVGDGGERLFLDWTEAAEMVAGGMAIGSHTHRHELLSRLPYDDQLTELRTSREILESRLGVRADVLAYPVGARSSFTIDTVRALKNAGYRAAFSYYGGVNGPGNTNVFDIRRIPVESDLTQPLFRLRLALASSTGHEMI